MLEFARMRVKRWKWCQYCQKTIFRGEVAYKVNGLPYLVCGSCKEGNHEKMATVQPAKEIPALGCMEGQ